MHNIHYWVYDENVSKAHVMADLQYQANQDGDGYSSRFTWHDNTKPFESYDEAMAFIKSVDKGWYDDHAVRFKDYSGVTSPKIAEYEKKIAELEESRKAYILEHSVHNLSAKHIGCPKCGSKLNKEFLVGEICPLCKTDLRSKTTLDKLRWYADKANDYNKRIAEEQRKQSKKAKIKWLVKFEYHS